MEEQAFTFLCQREGKDPRWIRIYSPYVRTCALVYSFLVSSALQFLYMERCVDRINEELLWKKVTTNTLTRTLSYLSLSPAKLFSFKQIQRQGEITTNTHTYLLTMFLSLSLTAAG